MVDKYLDEKRTCIYRVKQLHDEMERHMNNELRSSNLTMAQMGALMSIHFRKNDCCSLKELEQQMHLAQSTTAGIVKRLEEKELIHCETDEKDRRNKLVRISDEGIRLCEKASQGMNETISQAFGKLSKEELETFVFLLEKMCAPNS